MIFSFQDFFTPRLICWFFGNAEYYAKTWEIWIRKTGSEKFWFLYFCRTIIELIFFSTAVQSAMLECCCITSPTSKDVQTLEKKKRPVAEFSLLVSFFGLRPLGRFFCSIFQGCKFVSVFVGTLCQRSAHTIYTVVAPGCKVLAVHLDLFLFIHVPPHLQGWVLQWIVINLPPGFIRRRGRQGCTLWSQARFFWRFF